MNIWGLYCGVLLITLALVFGVQAREVSKPYVQELLNNAESAPEEIISLYHNILQEIAEREHYEIAAAGYQDVINSYSSLVRALNVEPEFDQATFTQRLESSSLAETEQLISVLKTSQLTTNADIRLGEEDVSTISDRLTIIPQEIEEVARQISEVAISLPHSEHSASRIEAQQMLVIAQRNSKNARSKMLRLEQLSSANRMELARLKAEQSKLKLSVIDEKLKLASQALAHLRKVDAEKTLASLNAASKKVTEGSVIEQDIFDTNVKLSSSLRLAQHQLEEYQIRFQDLSRISERINSLLRELQTGVDRFDPTVEFSAAIIEQLETLQSIPSLREVNRKANEIRVSGFSFRNQLRKSKLLENDLQTSDEVELLHLQQQLLNRNIDLNEQIDVLLRQAQSNIEALTAQQQKLHSLAFLHLTWIPNIYPVSADDIKDIWIQMGNVLKALEGEWRVTMDHFGVNSFPILILLLSYVYYRRFEVRYNQYLTRISDRIGNVKRDKGHYSWVAVAGLVVLALALPTVTMLAVTFNKDQLVMLPQLIIMIALGISINRFAKHLMNPVGVFIHHFRLDANSVIMVARHIFWFSPLLLISILIYEWSTIFSGDDLFNNPVRVLLMVSSALFSVATVWLYRLLQNNAKSSGGMRTPIRMLWWFVISIPIISFVMLAAGYMVASSMFLMDYIWTILAATIVHVAYLLSLRGISIIYRRMAFERALARRAAVLAQRDEDDENEAPLEELEDRYIDFSEVGAQASKLLRTAFLLLLYFALLPIWSDAFDSFSSLNEFTLWTVYSEGAEGKVATPITFKLLVTSIATCIFTIVSVRNLPGMLEILVLQRMQLSPGTGFAISTITKYLILVIGMMIAVGTLGFEWSSLQWLVAALTVGLGFGLQEIFANFVSGLMLLFEKPIRIGDTVTIRNMTGIVTRINTRATTLIDWDRKEVIIPNKAFITEDFVNWSLSDAITRIVIKVGVAYNSDPDLVTQLISDAAKECEYTLEDPVPDVFFIEFSDSSLLFELRTFTAETAHRLPATHFIHNCIYQKFSQFGVEIAFPQLDVHLNGSLDTMNDRSPQRAL
ncbi:mechanosensitive ion channel domain-containing protein [Echinimonas agarilytica]|uniref:Mechanosensitive ion channel n=1 Tax=Echinimonas agarilytica TaxID=1215918 RepID=A0AA41W6E1_9GAMM|nr:mechanosensitive ion channel domain-containing protein [Echinimonas agarilytica]MCM2679905.1 mechanosensitive ion channel [Echinimonas agarilytica]